MNAIAGIGNPQRFFNTLHEQGWRPKGQEFPDHARFAATDLQFDDTLPLLMTEKDAVKCRGIAPDNAWYLQVDAWPSPAFVDWLDACLVQLFPEIRGDE